MNVSPKTKGMTLVEVMVSLAVLLIFTTALLWTLLSGKTIWQASVARSSNREDLQNMVTKISHELSASKASLVTNNTSGSPAAFSFLSAEDRSGKFITDSNGAPVWQKYVIYYRPSGSTKLLRKEVYGSYTAALPQAQLIAYCDGQGKMLTAALASFTLTLGSNYATLAVTVQSTNAQGKAQQQSSDMNVYFLN